MLYPELFGEEALRALEQQRHQQACAQRQAEALLGPSPAGWAAAETGAAAESGHGESDAVTGRPAAAMQPPRGAADVGCMAVGRVGVDVAGPGWVPVYVGRLQRWCERYGGRGVGLGNPGTIRDDDDDARAETCNLCGQLEADPLGFQWPRRPGVRVDAWRLAAPARRQREATLERLVARVVAGENLLLLCHCRGRGKPVQAGTLCHGDGIAAELVRRAAAQVAGAAGQARGVAAGAGEPLASERARTADGAEHVD